jgi:hypothetical protein
MGSGDSGMVHGCDQKEWIYGDIKGTYLYKEARVHADELT